MKEKKYKRSAIGDKIVEAMKEVRKNLIAEKKRTGDLIVVSENGVIKYKTAEECEKKYLLDLENEKKKK